MTDEVARALAEIDVATRPTARRFDSAEPLSGRIAVLPSAFNPPTLAHMHLLETALAVEGVTGAAAMLSTRNVAKGIHGASLADRIGMLLAAREEFRWLAVLAVNSARLVDQADALRTVFPAAAFDFVVGFDTLVRLFDRKYYGDMEGELAPFFALHRVIATNRSEDWIDAVERFIENEAGVFRARIIAREIDDHPASMSSSGVREAIGAGLGSDHLPAAVLAYIRDRGLYVGER